MLQNPNPKTKASTQGLTLALFDLDNTLIAGDSDYAWGSFLCRKGLVDKSSYQKRVDGFYNDYKSGELDIHAYQAFILEFMKSCPNLNDLMTEFLRVEIEPLLLNTAKVKIEEHKAKGHTLMIITATNAIIAKPIANKLGISHLLATEPQYSDDQTITGKIAGTPCFQEGKVTKLKWWLKQMAAEKRTFSLDNAYFYSDSINDLPLLTQVKYAIAVDPDEKLSYEAQQRSWPITSFR